MPTDLAAGDALRVTYDVIRILTGLGVPYLLGGSLASSLHGAPRATADADLVADLRPAHVDAFVAALGERWYADRDRIAHAVRRRSSFNVIHLATMFKVDVFVLKDDPLSHREMARRQPFHLDELDATLDVATPEDVVLQKLLWYREGGHVSDRQWNDARGVVLAQGRRLDLPYLKAVASEAGIGDLLDEILRETSP